MAGAFHAVRVAKPGVPTIPPGSPAIVFANHPSWWDPAFFLVLDEALFPDCEAYGPIEAAQLGRYGFMKRIGVFGAEPGRDGAAAFHRTASGVLADPRRMLWITPEGDFRDPRARPVRFRPGLARLMADLEGVAAIPLALDYPFWSESRPEALARFGEPIPSGPGDAAEWNARLEAAMAATLDRLAEDAMARDPGRFETIVRGSSGVGGIYDLWRRLRAGLRGERFEAEHMSERKAT